VTATTALTAALQRQVLLLEDDLRARVAADPELEGRWKQEHRHALDNERTAASWVAWRDDRVTQAAVAWVLTSVFIRFCEDNGLVGPVWIAGPEQRRQEALDAQLTFFRTHPEDTDREWLQAAIDHLAALPAAKALVDSHSAHRLVSPSGNAVTRLLDFWRDRTEEGALVHDLRDPSLSTRFLGDLYQDLSQNAKDTYALLQTPVFVEEFILDRTLEPALKERPLEGFRMIDPTCGSGHFLLGAFDRLLDRWHRHAPGLELQARVQAALDAIHGVDLNPFAVAIARFRLTVAALQTSGLSSLEAAPAFTFHLAVGDSLIHGPDPGVLPGMSDRTAYMSFTYATEDGPLLLEILEEGRYDVVVGNPPYITVKDKALNQIYRSKYNKVCKGTYALTVPFMALFFALTKSGEPAGWVGQITSNSFMKREFGSKLIEDFLAYQDLRLVVDTSGAYIPGHGTPTVIIVGRNQHPTSSTIRAVLGIRGEPTRPDNPAKGIVWTSIVEHLEQPSWSDGWVTIADVNRSSFMIHPWSLAGGGAAKLKSDLDAVSTRPLKAEVIPPLGRSIRAGSDDAFEPPGPLAMPTIREFIRPFVVGSEVRDWVCLQQSKVIYPYATSSPLDGRLTRTLWPLRTTLRQRITFQGDMEAAGLQWTEYQQHTVSAYSSPLSIVVANVATHINAALHRQPGVFKETVVAIKMSAEATEADYLPLLGILNSSTACFWLKQCCHVKGGSGIGRGVQDEAWESRFAFNGANLADTPLPKRLPGSLCQELDAMGRALVEQSPDTLIQRVVPTAANLDEARSAADKILAGMVSSQEELDWECYRLYGLIDEDLTYGGDDLPGLAIGERAFEIVLARAVEAGEEETAWFVRHGSTAITEVPAHWPTAYRELVRRRLEVIATNPSIRLLEKPEYKRRWAQEPWENRQERALRDWLLDRLEDKRFWLDAQGRALPRSVGQLADEVGRDADMVSVLALWEGRPDVPVTQSLVRLLADEAVPFLAAYRYKDSGLRKREAWEETWRLQRLEDAGEKVGTIAGPPKYTSADFRKNSYWWDHAQQSLALLMIIGEREKDGWADERLVPLVAGLAELQPWVEQWHGEVDPDYGVSLAAFCREQLTARAAQVGKTLEELAAWRPAPAARGRRARSTT
jgi:hypothetical protein